MKKTLEINYGNSITVNRGNYENEKPMWHQKLTFELNGETPEEIAALEELEFSRIKTAIDERAKNAWDIAKRDMAGVRIRIKDGKKYPSVSSILKPDGIPSSIDPEYGIRGTEIHNLIHDWITTGKWRAPREPLSKLSYEDIHYQEFFTKFKNRIDLKNCQLNIELFHDKHLYSGEIDCIGLVDGLPTLIDFKTGSYDWTQLVAYYKGNNNVKLLAVFDLKNLKLETLNLKDVKCPDYWEKFLVKRGEFRARFGV